MRIVVLAREETLGFETAMGAGIGDVTAGGTLFVALTGAIFGVALGLGYVALRALLPSALWVRELCSCSGPRVSCRAGSAVTTARTSSFSPSR